MRRFPPKLSAEERRAYRLWSIGVFVVYGGLFCAIVGLSQMGAWMSSGSRDVAKVQISAK